MTQLTVWVYVAAEGALARGVTEYGWSAIMPTPAELQTLSPEQRGILAMIDGIGGVIWPHRKAAAIDSTDYTHGHRLYPRQAFAAPQLPEPTWAALREFVVALTDWQQRAQAAVDAEEQRKRAESTASGEAFLRLPLAERARHPHVAQPWQTQCVDPELIARVDAARDEGKREKQRIEYAHCEAIRQRNAAEAERREAQRAQVVAEYGTESQQQRYAAGVLPGHELADLIRSVVFAPLALFDRFNKISDGEFLRPSAEASIDYSVQTLVGMNAEQWAAAQKISAAVAQIDGAAVVYEQHTGSQEPGADEDDGSPVVIEISRCSAFVSVTWSGIPLSRRLAFPS